MITPPAMVAEAPAAAPDPGTTVYDMDSARFDRLAARAARREGLGHQMTIRFGGEEIAVVGAEFPLDVIQPFSQVDLDLGLFVRQAIDLATAKDVNTQLAALDILVSVLAANPNLPRDLIEATQEAARRLLTEDGYAKLTAKRPTPWDYAGLAQQLMRWYGIRLGESSSPSTSSTGGETSSTTSNGTATGSTPAATGGPSTIPSSEASGTSSPAPPVSPTTL